MSYYEIQVKMINSLFIISIVLSLALNSYGQEENTSNPVSTENERGLVETWDSASFSYQDWTVGCEQWQIDIVEGNPTPCARFASDSVLSNYSCGLSSKQYHIGLPFSHTLSFDLKLIDSTANNTEKIIMILYNWSEPYFFDTITNNGTTSWVHYNYYFSNVVELGRIRFLATGESSDNIKAWYIDNIYIERCAIRPIHLTAEVDASFNYDIIYLDWIVDLLPPWGSWIGLCGWSFDNAFGSTTGGAGLGQLFDIENDFPYIEHPFSIYKLRYFNSDYQNYFQQEEVYVLNGDGSEVLSGPHFINNGPPDETVFIPIDPVLIDSGNFMMATINTYPDGPYIGVDGSNYTGSLFFGSVGDWTELGEYGHYYVGSHQAFIAGGTFTPGVFFNIYRKYPGEDFVKLNDTLHEESAYIDTIPHNSICTYYVTGVYEGCESDSSNNVIIDPFVNTDNILINHKGISISPNPANDKITIHLGPPSNQQNELQCYDMFGRLVYSQIIGYGKLDTEIDVSSWKKGLYIAVLIREDQEMSKCKFVVL